MPNRTSVSSVSVPYFLGFVDIDGVKVNTDELVSKSLENFKVKAGAQEDADIEAIFETPHFKQMKHILAKKNGSVSKKDLYIKKDAENMSGIKVFAPPSLFKL